MKIKKGDKVKILLGKDRGKEGKVEFVLGKEKKVFVTDANLYKRHVRKMKGMEGGIISIPKPMNISNVALICPNCNKATRVGFKMEGSEKFRICKLCQKEIVYGAKA
ncbi:50S ribosomal protein L24 [Candidatus Daviesbacteria bacterium]|nr:50S ribosomal protein L24 [Candidatus Daviesbacteria bacterium]